MDPFKNLWRDTGPQFPNFRLWAIVIVVIIAVFCGLTFGPKW